MGSFFKKIGRDVYSIVRLGVDSRTFSGDACLCFDGAENETENLTAAQHYWNRDVENETPVVETLADGRNEVLEILEEYHK